MSFGFKYAQRKRTLVTVSSQMMAYGIGRNIALERNKANFSEIGIISAAQYKFMNSSLNTKYSITNM